MVEGFRRLDPPTTPQLAVPVTVANECFLTSKHSDNPKKQAAGCLALIAFYYLLRVGEYTKPRMVTRNGARIRATRTVQFMISNVGFFKEGKIIPRSSPLNVLLACDAATLKINNQKNGRMGDTIHHEAVNIECCPVKALAMRVHHVLSNGGNEDSLLCDYFIDSCSYSIESEDIINLVREAATKLNLAEFAIDPNLLGSHSLRAGGAMALKLHGFDDTTIMKMGRWTSLTFLQYIHNQIAHLSKDVADKMSQPLPFLNIAAIEGAT
jgi:hypothetical protein